MFFGSLKSELRHLREKIEKSTEGGSFFPIEIKGETEVTSLADTVNSLGRELNKALEEIQQLRILEAKYKNVEDSLKEYQSFADYVEVINELGQSITSKLNVEEIYQNIRHAIQSMMDVEEIELGYLAGRKGPLQYISIVTGKEIPEPSHISPWVFKNKIEVILDDAQANYGRYLFEPILATGGRSPKSVLSFPLGQIEQPIGVMSLYSFRQSAFTKEQIQMVRSLLPFLAVAMDNAAVYEELKQTQAGLAQSEKMASLGKLTAGLAHEINNPINFIAGGISAMRSNIRDVEEVISSYDELDSVENVSNGLQQVKKLRASIDFDITMSEMRELLGPMDAGVKRTAEIIQGLQVFSRLNENEVKKVNMVSNLESILSLFLPGLPERITLEREFLEFLEVDCSSGDINQAILNILQNALQAIPDSGIIKMKLWNDAQNAFISIMDNGVGIKEENLKKIFDPFFTTRDVGQGAGLGLSTAYSIVDKHKGRITVESAEGNGSEFTVILPLHSDSNS